MPRWEQVYTLQALRIMPGIVCCIFHAKLSSLTEAAYRLYDFVSVCGIHDWQCRTQGWHTIIRPCYLVTA